ncbi:MAG: peptide chain release factor N(5)-glutamine methyltransferase [Myxococcales bacterium]|nr:peptide chain release factor N(5)-glutamine methyltransferase [Myxococcales bacterium]
MPDPWTIRRVLSWMTADLRARGIETARLDSELLVAHALGANRLALYLDLDRPLTPDELASIRSLHLRRRAREPVAYIVGRREFWNRDFEVGPAVLVPRPETELLVERALAIVPADSAATVLELCTGSGCVAVSLALERPSLRVVATDVSAAALEVALRNASRHRVSGRVELRRGDLWDAVLENERFALVVANPPYVAEEDIGSLAPEIRDHEPRAAVSGGPGGLQVIERIAQGARAHLEPGGRLLLEVGAGQAERVERLLTAEGLVPSGRHRDLSGVERVVEAAAPTL